MAIGTILSTLGGFASSFLPDVMEYFKKKQQFKQQIELRKLDIEAAERQVDLDIQKIEARATAEEGENLREHSAMLQAGPIVNNLRASVRPVITYLFFTLFAVIEGVALHNIVTTGGDIQEGLQYIWDADTRAIFGAVIGFWFGSRTIEKLKGNHKNK